MPRPCRQNDDIAGDDVEGTAGGTAKLHGGMAGGDAKHLVRRGVKVQERMDPVTPAIGPAMPGEETLEPGRCVASLFCRHDIAIQQHGQGWIVRRLVVALEPEIQWIGPFHRRIAYLLAAPGNHLSPGGLFWDPKENDMRYQVLPATSQDVAYLATVLEDVPGYLDWPEKEPGDRLLEACAFSTQIWAARRLSDGSTSALWGVTPRLDSPDVGYLWMLASATFDEDSNEFAMLCRLVFAEMLDQFGRIEQHIDVRKDRTIDLLRGLGFTIGRARRHADSPDIMHHVWLEAEHLRHTSNLVSAMTVH